jgi:hypothetical protein
MTQLSWRYTFAVVVPAALGLLAGALRIVRRDEGTDGVARPRLDVAGALSVTGAALLFVWAVVQAPSVGWLSLQSAGALALAAALLATFVVVERRVEQPLVRLALLRSVRLVRANVCALLLLGGATVFNVANTLYEQDVLGWGPLKTGVVFMVASITTGVLLAISTAATLAATPTHPTAAQTVHGLHAGMSVALIGAGLIALMSVATLLARRRHDGERAPEVLEPFALDALERAA